MKAKILFGLTLIAVGLFWPQIKERIPDFTIPSKPSIDIMEPSEEIKEKVSSAASKVTDEKDRLNLAIFNMVFSERVLSYDVEAQAVNDVYVAAAKNAFGNSLAGKYQGYGSAIQSLFTSNMGEENHILTQLEKEGLSKDFNGLAFELSRR